MMEIRLTPMEAAALKEAVRYVQQDHEETFGTLDRTLSRIQRKLGEEPNS